MCVSPYITHDSTAKISTLRGAFFTSNLYPLTLLPITSYLLPITYYLLPITYYLKYNLYFSPPEAITALGGEVTAAEPAVKFTFKEGY